MSNEEIVQEIQNGINVTENMELLYRQNMPLIRRFIKPYSHYENMEDLEQESYFGLFEATKNYDPNKEVKFITYARDRKSTRLNSSHSRKSRMPSSA